MAFAKALSHSLQPARGIYGAIGRKKEGRRFVRPPEAPFLLSVFSYALLTTGPFAVSITA